MPRAKQPIVRASLVHEVEIDGALYEIDLTPERMVRIVEGHSEMQVTPEAARYIANILVIVADSAPPKKRIRKPATRKVTQEDVFDAANNSADPRQPAAEGHPGEQGEAAD